jgi:hypothetical protein
MTEHEYKKPEHEMLRDERGTYCACGNWRARLEWTYPTFQEHKRGLKEYLGDQSW